MSGDDELERLLREVDATLSGPAKVPATQGSASPAARPAAGSAPAQRARVASGIRTGAIAGVVCGAGVGATTFFLSWLPLIDNPVSSGMGAFVGAFLTGAVLGARRPPG
jgi:hypothetical protein